MSSLPVVIVAGPTASGKTSFAIELAEDLRRREIYSEVINADSIQLYNDLKVLTAFPTTDEMKRVPHHLFGILGSSETCSAGKWKQIAESKIDELHNEGKIPILCGGTGFYLNAIIRGIAKIPDVPESHRKKVFEKFQKIGREAFMQELLKLDPENELNQNNTQRILRAYEVASFTGRPLSYWWNHGNHPKYNNIKTLVLLPTKERLRENILERSVWMLENGAIDEVRIFQKKHPYYKGPLDKVIGFVEIQDFLNQRISKESLIDQIFVRTRQYAKRQSTWFRHQISNAKFAEIGSKNVLVEFSKSL